MLPFFCWQNIVTLAVEAPVALVSVLAEMLDCNSALNSAAPLMDFKECLNSLESWERSAMTDERLLRYLPRESTGWVSDNSCASGDLFKIPTRLQSALVKPGSVTWEQTWQLRGHLVRGQIKQYRKTQSSKGYSVWAEKRVVSLFQRAKRDNVVNALE